MCHSFVLLIRCPAVLLVFTLVTTSLVSAKQAGSDRAVDEQSIRELVSTFETGWNTHDTNAIGSIFRDDAEFINVVGMHWRGKSAIVKAHTVYHEIMFRDCKLHTDQVQIRFPAAGSAIAVWTATQDAFTTPSGSVAPKTQTRLTLLLTKANDQWLVVHGHNTRVDAEAAKFDPVNQPK